MGIQWGNIGNTIAILLAIGVMVVAVGMLGKAKKGQLFVIFSAGAGVLFIVGLFTLAFTNQLIPVMSTVLTFIGLGGGTAPAFTPGVAP